MLKRCDNCFNEYEDSLGLCPYCGFVSGEAPEDIYCLTPGTLIADRYIIGEKLGMGGFGITYKAWDRKLNIVMAVKEYFPSGLVNRLPGTTAVILVAPKKEREFSYGKSRFLEEARNLAMFNTHPNIVNVFEYFEANNTAYIVMEYLDGQTLGQTIQNQNGPLPYEYCVQIASSLCSALRSIHKENILHRDISPDNIMLCANGKVKLFDFGAARFSSGIENLTIVIKPGFAPPEQYEKVNKQSPRTDIYALGATLYYALTGEKPEESTDRKVEDTLKSPSALIPDIPQYISVAIMRAMSVEPQYRFANVDEFEKGLLNEKKIRTEAEERKKRRAKRLFGIIVSLAVVVGLGASAYLTYKEASKAVLPDAALTLWYSSEESNEITAAKGSALTSIVENFTEGYSNVSLQVHAKTQTELEDRDASVHIFESTKLDQMELGSALSLSELINTLDDNTYAQDELSHDTQYPTGIVVPIIYVNNTMGTITSTDSLEHIVEDCASIGEYLVMAEDAVTLYASLYGDESADYYSENAKEDFLSRNAFVYLGTSSDYLEVREALPGEYTVMLPDCGVAVYRYGTLWSIADIDDDIDETAKSFLSYLTSDLAQEYFYIQNQSIYLPITKSGMSVYLSIYDELVEISDYLELPFSAPADDIEKLIANADPSRLESLRASARITVFDDVAEDSWYWEAISAMCTAGLMQGVSDTSFAPDNTMTKGEALTALYRLAGLPSTAGASEPFSDINTETEAGKAAIWAFENGLVSASADGMLHGSNSIDLETTAVLFYRYARLTRCDLSITVSPDQYADGSSISAWASDGVMWAITKGILSAQSGSNIDPQAELTRGRFAVLLYRLYELINAGSVPELTETNAADTEADPYDMYAAFFEDICGRTSEYLSYLGTGTIGDLLLEVSLIDLDLDGSPELLMGFNLAEDWIDYAIYDYVDQKVIPMESNDRYGSEADELYFYPFFRAAGSELTMYYASASQSLCYITEIEGEGVWIGRLCKITNQDGLGEIEIVLEKAIGDIRNDEDISGERDLLMNELRVEMNAHLGNGSITQLLLSDYSVSAIGHTPLEMLKLTAEKYSNN